MKKDDLTIERIRKARYRISERNDHNPKRIVAYYIKLQKKYRPKLTETPD